MRSGATLAEYAPGTKSMEVLEKAGWLQRLLSCSAGHINMEKSLLPKCTNQEGTLPAEAV